jgi:hypothetical protein
VAITLLLVFRRAQRGQEEKTSMKSLNTPATTKKGYVPHDRKQYDLPSGALESLDIRNMQAVWPSTNLEMTLKKGKGVEGTSC